MPIPVPTDDRTVDNQKKQKDWKFYVKCSAIILFVTVIVLFILVFVVVPLVVMWSLPVQRFFIFTNVDQPKNPQYKNSEYYGLRGVRNFYVTVNDLYDKNYPISMGVWHLVPEDLIQQTVENADFDYDESLKNSSYDVVIYFHGNGGTRIAPSKTYEVLRKLFHVIAVDYRSYGDSTDADLSEDAVVYDMVQFYKWARQKTNSNIYVWGHSLGTAISTHAISILSNENTVPMGLVLEAPFTTMREEISEHPLGKVFRWLPWFEATILDPIEENGFVFATTKNILKVDCPIMILHAEDDSIIPYTLGRQLAKIASTERTPSQGNVTYYQFEASYGYDHIAITQDSRVLGYIRDFIKICEAYNIGT